MFNSHPAFSPYGLTHAYTVGSVTVYDDEPGGNYAYRYGPGMSVEESRLRSEFASLFGISLSDLDHCDAIEYGGPVGPVIIVEYLL